MADLVVVTEKVFNNQEILEDRQTKELTKVLDKQSQGLIKVLLAVSGNPETKVFLVKHTRKSAFGNSKPGGKGLKTRPRNRPNFQSDKSLEN